MGALGYSEEGYGWLPDFWNFLSRINLSSGHCAGNSWLKTMGQQVYKVEFEIIDDICMQF